MIARTRRAAALPLAASLAASLAVSLAASLSAGSALAQDLRGPDQITGADEAVSIHQRVAESVWRDALKGASAAARVRELIQSHSRND